MASLKASLCIVLLINAVQANENTLTLWHYSYDKPHVRSFVELAILKAADKYPQYSLKRAKEVNKTTAFKALTQANQLDIIVAALDPEAEKNSLPIYIPVDRGLLGFRTCLISPESQPLFDKIQTVNDLSLQKLTFGVDVNWTDKKVMLSNELPLLDAPNYRSLMAMLRQHKVKCVSRSVMDMDASIANFPEFTPEQQIAFIYPFGKIIYVNQQNKAAYEMLKYGLEKAVQDRSFYQLFNQYFAKVLEEQNFYYRKILLIKNPVLSEPGHKAINKYGIASFSQAGEH